MTTACRAPAQVDAEPRSGLPNPSGRQTRPQGRWSRTADRIAWTTTGAALGFGLAVIAIAIYVRDLWIS